MLKVTVSLLDTLLNLGHATSQNLAFSYKNELISYGEETITESNLLEIRRRHPKQVDIETFGKVQESVRTGADWEWHIVGRRHTLRMRVQAKRVDKFGNLRNLKHKASGAALPQIDLLIQDAQNNGLRPIYCFYSTEAQRSVWKKGESAGEEWEEFENGCLLADALRVREVMPNKLLQIEPETVPWHYLWAHQLFTKRVSPYEIRLAPDQQVARVLEEVRGIDSGSAKSDPMRLPTVWDLNEGIRDDTDAIGIDDRGAPTEVSAALYRERGIGMVVVIDVRNFLDLWAYRLKRQ